jgi:hypothetical protein
MKKTILELAKNSLEDLEDKKLGDTALERFRSIVHGLESSK